MALPTRHVSVSSSTNIIKFTNCFIIRNHQIVKDDLWVRKGKILTPAVVFYSERRTPNRTIDCGGALIAPGFIDLQINGGFGVDFTYEMEKVDEAVTKVAQGILAHGVTSFLPTIVSSTPDAYKTLLPRIRKRIGGLEGASVLGIHLEGPFINIERKGAHDPAVIQNGFEKGFESVKEMYGEMGTTRIVTLAPELPNALDVIEKLFQEKVIVSMGHSNADFNIAEKAMEKGASCITHLFNAMVPFHHRDPGLIGLIGGKSPVMFGLICDNTHTHPATIQIAHRANPEGVVLVTDAISALGLPEGTHHLGKFSVDVVEGKAYLSGTDILAGSVTSFIDCVKNFKQASGCTLVEALEAGSLHPAKALKMERIKGTLSYGADADFILLNDKLEIIQTWIAGKCVYKNEHIEDYTFSYNPYDDDDAERIDAVKSVDVKSKRNAKVYFNAELYEGE